MNIIDCHTHTNNSPDGDDTVLAMCRKAQSLGLSAYAITDHCECNGYESEHYDVTSEKSFSDIMKAKEEFGGKLNLICGIELGQANQDYEAAEKVISDERLDFVIGSVHNLTGFADFAFLDYPHENIAHLLKAYYDEMLEICRWGKFDVLGHLTYPLRYICGERGIPVDMSPYEETIREIFKTLIENGKGVEINTSGLRQKYGRAFPDFRYIKLFRDLGGEIISIGSDSHCTEDLGKGVREGAELAREAGFTRLTYFKERNPLFVKL